MLKIVHLWKSDYFGAGGGAIAMHRLHQGLRRAGVDSTIICQKKTIDEPYSFKLSAHRLLKSVDFRLNRLLRQTSLHDIHLVSSFQLRHNRYVKRADVIHIHGLHGFINYLTLPYLSFNKPTVFTLHDMWPYTGHCAYSYDCERWRTGCGQCPYPDNHPAIAKDNTRIEWLLKRITYRFSKLIIVSLSTVKDREARYSMLKRFPIYQIPNGIDTTLYKPLDPVICRQRLGIPTDKFVLMFSALDLKQKNKGGDLLLLALDRLPDRLKQDVVLLMAGGGGDHIAKRTDFAAIDLGFLSDDHTKAMAYSAADLFVSPTRAEMLPLVLQESMACGTPSVAFNVGGVADIVRHGQTGYAAEPENHVDLSRGIQVLLDNGELRRQMGIRGRKVTRVKFDLRLQVDRHLHLYEMAAKGR